MMDTVKTWAKRTLKRIKNAWKKKSPYKRWRLFYGFAEYLDGFIQIGVFRSNGTGPRGYAIGILAVIYLYLLGYTVYFNIKNGQPEACLTSFCVFGVTLSVSMNQSVFG